MLDETAKPRARSRTKESPQDSPANHQERSAHKQADVTSVKRIPAFSTIGNAEKINLLKTLHRPLSGYLGGAHHPGRWVSALANQWCELFGVPYAVPCNSATSGLLAACMAVGIGPGDLVWAPAYSMSATAACAKVLGARVKFIDIESRTFGLNLFAADMDVKPQAVIVTNLFGHPAFLKPLREWCDLNHVWMIEDNAQSPFADEDGAYAGTIGHIGVFSLNVHKHIQCGEGGVAVTRDQLLALRLEDAINHGELREGGMIGLNLRMTEPTAAIACAQLAKAIPIIYRKREIALALNEAVQFIPWIAPPRAAIGCTHVYYVWAAKVDETKRSAFVATLNERGFPIREGYAPLLTKVFGSDDRCPVAERVENEEIVIYENCAYNPTIDQLRKMCRILGEVSDQLS